MSRTKPAPNDVIEADLPAARRFQRECLLIDEARASVAAGAFVPDDQLDAWLDRMVESEEPMPIPDIQVPKVGTR